jgi:hypothetical protein
MRDLLLTSHVLVGTTALLLGPCWLLLRMRGAAAVLAAWTYQASVAAVAFSAAVLALTSAGLQWLLPVALVTEALAVAGALARRRGWRGWRSWQPHLLGGSYIALVTGVLVAQTGNPVFWLLPAVVGQVPIAVAKHRLRGPVPAAVIA